MGKQGWLVDETHRAVRENGLAGLVTFTGYVDDQNLPTLYSLADAFAFPSVYEGFGLPPLEAMACGAPVVCSNASSLPEIVGDAALLVPPMDIAGWVQALQRILTEPDLRADLSARGPKSVVVHLGSGGSSHAPSVRRPVFREVTLSTYRVASFKIGR